MYISFNKDKYFPVFSASLLCQKKKKKGEENSIHGQDGKKANRRGNGGIAGA